MNSDIIAFIFARGGSKGVPGKNIRHLGGKPLIAWSIEQARSIKRVRRVIVSTDCKEIADISLQFGAEIPFMRPADLAADISPEWLAWRHALNYIQNTEKKLPKGILSVPATAPLRSVLDLENCIDEYEKGGADVIITVTESRRNPYFNMVKINDDNSAELIGIPDSSIERRQDCPIAFDMTTVAYVVKPEFIFTNNAIFEGRVRAVNVPPERAIDIDTLLDFQIAECLIKKI